MILQLDNSFDVHFSSNYFFKDLICIRIQGTSRFLAQGGGGGGGHFEVKEGHPDFFTNNIIFLECGVIALIEAFYMFKEHNHVKSFDLLNDYISFCSAQVTISQEVAR